MEQEKKRKAYKDWGKKVYFVTYKGKKLKRFGMFSSKWNAWNAIKKEITYKDERKDYGVDSK